MSATVMLSRSSSLTSVDSDTATIAVAPLALAAPAAPPVGDWRVLVVCFIVAVAVWYAAVYCLPDINEERRALIRLPTDVQQMRALSNVLREYAAVHYWYVVALFSYSYVLLQTFAIPGAIFLSIIAGPLFGTATALIIVSANATVGASICYALSYRTARNLVERTFPVMLDAFRQRIAAANGDRLFFYLLFLRISPLLPNWFINVASPLIGIPYRTFLFATLFGLIPANYIHITTGNTLHSLGDDTSSSSGWYDTLYRMALLTLIAVIALVPAFAKDWFVAFEQRMQMARERAHKHQ